METNEKMYNLLIEYANKIKDGNLLVIYNEINNLSIEINNTFNTNLIDGERLLIHNILMNISITDPKYKDFLDDSEFIEWMTKEYHDNYFDYYTFKESVVECANLVIKNMNQEKRIKGSNTNDDKQKLD